LRIAVAIDQAIRNAMFRGNLEIDSHQKVPSIAQTSPEEFPPIVEERLNAEPYKDRKVAVVMEIKPSGFAMRVCDDGPGFDTQLVGSWTASASRGINLIKAFMDNVKFSERGNEIKLSYAFDRGRVRRKKVRQISTPASANSRLICQATGAVHAISERKHVIGRRAACHLRLPGDSIAPLHCMLVNEGDHLMLLNLTPEFETLVNGKPGNGKALKSGDKLQIGEHKFLFEDA
jgi:hypothetical protein